MSATTQAMVNEEYDPGESEEQILDVLKRGRDANEPWGRATPSYLREVTGIEKGNIEFHLRNLTTAGWVEKTARGLYELREDPRDEASERDLLEDAARERWGEEFRTETTEWMDGDVEIYAYHNAGRNEDGLRVREKMGIYDGDVGVVRELCDPEPVVDEEILLDPTSEEDP